MPVATPKAYRSHLPSAQWYSPAACLALLESADESRDQVERDTAALAARIQAVEARYHARQVSLAGWRESHPRD